MAPEGVSIYAERLLPLQQAKLMSIKFYGVSWALLEEIN